jgi:hypothetical protein
LKSKTTKEITSLNDKLTSEKKKRMNLYEEKIDKNTSLLHDLLEKDNIIFSLNKQLGLLREKLQLYGAQARSHTPKNHMYNSLHESAMNPYFG